MSVPEQFTPEQYAMYAKMNGLANPSEAQISLGSMPPSMATTSMNNAMQTSNLTGPIKSTDSIYNDAIKSSRSYLGSPVPAATDIQYAGDGFNGTKYSDGGLGGFSSAKAGQVVKLPDGTIQREGYLWNSDINNLSDYSSVGEAAKYDPEFAKLPISEQTKQFNAAQTAQSNKMNNTLGWVNAGLGAVDMGVNAYYAGQNFNLAKKHEKRLEKAEDRAQHRLTQAQSAVV